MNKDFDCARGFAGNGRGQAINHHDNQTINNLVDAAEKALAYINQLPLSKTTRDPLPPIAELEKAIAGANCGAEGL